ncbi:beta-ketoacyl synthase [Beggiatoa sp. PS]|nr:beta-ketoacyl synthase [Beggiatoa sp. PS]
MTKRRVVVTGLGAVSPVGLTVKESWKAILAGKSGITTITNFDASKFTSQFAGQIKNFDVTQYLSIKEAKKMDTFIHYGIAASVQAIEDAGLEITEANAERIGIAIGSGIGGLPGIEKGHSAYLKGGPRRITPFFVPANIINMVAGNLSVKYGMKGPNYGISTACSTGTHNIGNAARLIEYGDADVMIVWRC